METLLVKLDQERLTAQWLVLDESGQPHAAIRDGGLDQLKDFSQQRRVVCLLDGSLVLLDQVVLPAGRNRRKLIQAIPYALEDDLAEDLDDLHFALGRDQVVGAVGEDAAETVTGRQVTIPVAIIAREKMQNCLRILSEAGVKAHSLLPDQLALPLADGQWQVLIYDDHAIVRTGPQTGFNCDLNNLVILLDTALDQSSTKPERIQIWNHTPATLELNLLHKDIEINITQTDQSPLVTLARGYRRETQINLLQGEYAHKEEYGKLLKNWLVPATLLGAWILIALITKTIGYIQLKSESSSLQEQMTEIYLQVFPDSKNLYGQRNQLEERLKALGGGGDNPLLQLLNAVTAQLNATTGTTIRALDFNGEILDVELKIAEVQQLEQMRQQLQNQGLTAEIRSADTEGDSVTGKLRLQLP
jgi:general secretion pathway protein L